MALDIGRLYVGAEKCTLHVPSPHFYGCDEIGRVGIVLHKCIAGIILALNNSYIVYQVVKYLITAVEHKILHSFGN